MGNATLLLTVGYESGYQDQQNLTRYFVKRKTEAVTEEPKLN